jgi:predicted transcriptional regulator
MSDTRILETTASGRAALAVGHAALDFASRTALILVDGKLTVDGIAELLTQSRISNAPLAAIQKLLDEGFVTVVTTPGSNMR